MYTNTTRFTGLSGIDTEAMVKQLMVAESVKYTKLLKTNQLTTWKQEAYRSASSQLKTFQDSFLSLAANATQSMRLSTNFKTLTTSIKLSGTDTASTDISVTADPGVTSGSGKLTVKQIAKAEEFSSTNFTPTITGSEKLDVNKLVDGDNFSISLDNGTARTITFDRSDLNKLKALSNADYNSEDEKTAAVNQGFVDILNTKLADAFGSDAVVKDSNGNPMQKITAKVDADGHLSISTLNNHSARLIDSSSGTLDFLGIKDGAVTGFTTSQTLEDLFGSKSNAFKDSVVSFEINGKSFEFDKTDSMDHVMETINKSDANATLTFDSEKAAFILKSNDTGAGSSISFSDINGKFFEEGLGMGAISEKYSTSSFTPTVTGSGKLDATKIVAGDHFRVSLDGDFAKTILFNSDDVKALKDLSDAAYATEEEKTAAINEGFIKILNKKLTDTFGTDTSVKDANGNPAQRVTANITADGNLSISTLNGHSASLSDSSFGSMAKLGLDDGTKTEFSTSQTLGELLAGDSSAFGTYLTDSILKFEINDKTFEFKSTQTMDDVMRIVNASDANATLSFDSETSKFVLSSKNANEGSTVTFKDLTGKFFESGLGIGADSGSSAASAARVQEARELSATRTQEAQDAIIVYNGVETTRESNEFNMEGFNISLGKDSEGKDFDIGITTDITATKEIITKFVEEYNKLLEELNKQVNTPRPTSGNYSYYEPLTDEEKAEMTETQIENWEEKAKTGMLYRDSLLSGITQSMRSQLYQAVDLGDGKKISLHEIGITTANQVSNKAGTLVIDDAKLTKALEERGEDVKALFTQSSSISASDTANRAERIRTQGLGERLNDIINTATGASGTITAKAGIVGTTSESNNELYRTLKSQNDKISDMLDYLADREDHYYLMFSRLETAMSQADSQMASLQSLLGQM